MTKLFEFWKVFGIIDQKLDAQIDALECVGAGRIFLETISGATAKRPELQRMLDQLREGDVVVVTKYDRLARSLRDLLDIVEAIKERGAGFRSLAEDIDTTTPAGELIFHVFACEVIAQGRGTRLTKDLPCQLTDAEQAADLRAKVSKPARGAIAPLACLDALDAAACSLSTKT